MKIDEFLTRIDLDNSKDTIFKTVKAKEFHGEKNVTALYTRMDLQSGNGSVSAIFKSSVFPLDKVFVLQPNTIRKILDVSNSIELADNYTIIAKGEDSVLEWHLANDDTPEIKQQMDENKIPWINPAKFPYLEGIKLSQSLVKKILKYHNLVNMSTFHFIGDGKQVKIVGKAGDGENKATLVTLPIGLTYDEFYDTSFLYALKALTNTDAVLYLGKAGKDGKVPPLRIMVEDGDAEINYFVERVLPPTTKTVSPETENPEEENKTSSTESEPEPSSSIQI